MLVGYVSDERYLALDGASFLFENETGSVEAHSQANGAVNADLQPGQYKVTLRKDGYGAKSVQMTVTEGKEYQFRLLSDTLAGYMWPKVVRSGERSEYRVHAVEPYRLDLYRYGWEKEHIRTIGWFDEHGPLATMQITPDGDYTQTGVEWNRRGYRNNPHHTQFITAPQRSGLYYLHAKTESGQFCSFPWVVAPKKPQADIAVLASTISWNAYNNFGGRSNYIHPAGLPERPTVNARLDLLRYTSEAFEQYSVEDYMPLSLDRPEPLNHIPQQTQIDDPLEGRAGCHLCPAEWRLFGWLEREGFSYDLYSETQFHSGLLNLDDYRVLVISAHPEYWSAEMYFTLKKWVFERGGKLLYLGGNGLNCAVTFPDENTVIYRNSRRGGSLADLAAEGKESRFHVFHESEANLLGVRYTESGAMTGAPYKVIDAGHWVFAGTGLSEGDLFGEKSLHVRCSGGASGHETDKISPSSPKNIQLLAKGLNIDEGGAEMVYHQTESGGEVFSAGSINYPCSLPVDEHISRITANVLRRFCGR